MSWTPALPPNAWLRWDAVSRRLPAGIQDVLEIGCGQGAFGVRLARSYRYVGIDSAAESLALARSRFEAHESRGELRAGDESVIHHDEMFDLVCAFEVLEHIEDDRGAVARWSSYLRPGGWLMLSTPAWRDRFKAWDELAGHQRRYDPAEMIDLLVGVGLVEVTATPFGGPAGFALEAIRDQLARRRGTASAGESKEDRTAASGRFMRLPDGRTAIAPWVLSTPLVLSQRLFPRRGPNLLSSARRPLSGEKAL